MHVKKLYALLICFALVGLWPAAADAAQRRRAKSARAARAKKTPASKKSRAGAEKYAAGVGAYDDDDGEGRGRWFYFKRAYPSGQIPAGARRRAWESRPGKGRPLRQLNGAALWTPIGPAPTTPRFPNNWGHTAGRVNAVAVNPADPQVVIVGASTGGLWRSTNGGLNFSPVSDNQVDLAVGALAFAPSNPAVVYAGMGDLDNSYVGTGVLRSTDGGATWSRVSNASLPEPGYVEDLAVDPADPNRVYAAQDVSFNTTTNQLFTSGVYVSTDGGVNWARTLPGRARNVAIHPTNPSVLYAAMRTATGQQPGVYKSTNGGQTWSPVYTSPFGTTTRDIRVATTPADPERVYVFVGVRTPADLRFEVSDDGGATWATRGAPLTSQVDPGQFGYNTYLRVSPADANTVFLGTRDIYKSTDGGATWTNITGNFHRTVDPQSGNVTYPYDPTLSNTHPDQQAFAFSPDNPNVIFAGNDGGLSRSADGGQTFQSVNASLSLTQFVHLSLHPTDPNISYGGTQDNGTQRRISNGGSVEWVEFNEGDGGRSVINPSNPSMIFSTYVFGRVHRNGNNGLTGRTVVADEESFGEPSSAPRIAFYPPLTGNGVDHRLYFGTWRLFICTNCDTQSVFTLPSTNWAAPAGERDLTACSESARAGGTLTAIGVARSNTNVIYTGSSGGCVMASQDGGVNWTEAWAGLPFRFVESIVVHPSNPALAYLSVSGYGTGHVFRTTNGGASWADVSGNLPNIPTNALLLDPLDPNIVYAGTDIGVFRSPSGGSAWESFNDGMPPVVVTAFAAQPSGRIQAATYGRGAYEFANNLGAPPTVSFDALNVAGSETSGRARLTVRRTSGVGAASVDYATADGSATDRGDYTTARGTLSFASGETSKTIDILLSDDRYQEPTESFNVVLSNPVNLTLAQPGDTATVQITSDEQAPGQSPVKWENFDAAFFVRQHYLDFLGREPDADGLAHWTGQTTFCGNPNPEICRVNVSASFFLAIEFQETSYLAYKTHKAAFGNLSGKPVPLTFLSMLSDSRRLGDGVEVGVGDWFARLQANKAAYFDRFAASTAFTTRYPPTMSHEQFVGALNANAGNALDAGERQTLVNELLSGAKTRAQALRRVAEDGDFHAAEQNRAFVLMQYFGYLRRDPDAVGFDGNPDPQFLGYNHWLTKLNEHNGNFVNAEMVRSFIISIEYGQRFGH
jgi:photosystem II stability/assembly factor-like uncharacterized protein